jgi:hypothetical protein
MLIGALRRDLTLRLLRESTRRLCMDMDPRLGLLRLRLHMLRGLHLRPHGLRLLCLLRLWLVMVRDLRLYCSLHTSLRLLHNLRHYLGQLPRQ